MELSNQCSKMLQHGDQAVGKAGQAGLGWSRTEVQGLLGGRAVYGGAGFTEEATSAFGRRHEGPDFQAVQGVQHRNKPTL